MKQILTYDSLVVTKQDLRATYRHVATYVSDKISISDLFAAYTTGVKGFTQIYLINKYSTEGNNKKSFTGLAHMMTHHINTCR